VKSAKCKLQNVILKKVLSILYFELCILHFALPPLSFSEFGCTPGCLEDMRVRPATAEVAAYRVTNLI